MEFQVTSREFNRNSAKIREESLHKPVIITVRKTATELFAHKKAAYCDLESELVRNKELVKAPEFD